MSLRAWLMLLLLAATGCATTGDGSWQDAPPTPVAHRHAACEITLPAGWIFLQRRQGDAGDLLIATRRGVALQSIRLTRLDNDKAFPAIEKPASPDMPGEELARRYVQDWAARFELDVVDVIESSPAELGGEAGFRVHLAYRIGGLRYQAIALGASTPRAFYLLSYSAPTLHYFDADRAAFEESARSLTFAAAP